MTSRTSSPSSMAVLRLSDDVAAAADDVRAYIGAEIRALLDNRDFTEALAGFLLPDPASQARRSLLEGRLRSLSIP